MRKPGAQGRNLRVALAPSWCEPRRADAGVGARSDQGRALSPTASVMKDTWMKSDSQLSTYMNHMAPPSRPAPDRRDGPARSGSGDTEPPPLLPRPRPADGPTTVRRRRENPGPRAASGRVWTSAARRLGGPTAAVPRGARARGPAHSRGYTEGESPGEVGRSRGAGRSASTGAQKAASGPSLRTPTPTWSGFQGRGGRHDPSPATSGPKPPGQVVHRVFSWLPLVKGAKLLSA